MIANNAALIVGKQIHLLKTCPGVWQTRSCFLWISISCRFYFQWVCIISVIFKK